MSGYEIDSLADRVGSDPYVGRGIVVGKTPDGRHACVAYFIMGRSHNSRNRVFAEHDGAVFTEPFEASLVEDPRLIIYAAVRAHGNRLIVTNGDQTDTVWEALRAGGTFSEALATREFEPDAPNWTPRISAMLTFAEDDFTYEMSILKSADAAGSACNRFTFSYAPLAGLGHFLHTYVGDGDPLPTFYGEPERVAIPNDIDTCADTIWNALDSDNRISLYVRYVDLTTGQVENRLVNKYR